MRVDATVRSTRQEALLRLSLAEAGLAPSEVVVDHDAGESKLDGRVVGLVHPESFFDATRSLVEREKTLDFFFSGYVRPRNGRRSLLAPFAARENALVEESDRGRDATVKTRFDPRYYERLSSARFGLCPHNVNWPGSKTKLWTYRFVDCCLVGAIPVLFRATPLRASFVDGFSYRWDDAPEFVYVPSEARRNRRLAEKRWRL